MTITKTVSNWISRENPFIISLNEQDVEKLGNPKTVRIVLRVTVSTALASVNTSIVPLGAKLSFGPGITQLRFEFVAPVGRPPHEVEAGGSYGTFVPAPVCRVGLDYPDVDDETGSIVVSVDFSAE